MNYKKAIKGELTSVRDMATFSFGEIISDNMAIMTNLPDIVCDMVKQSLLPVKFTMKEIHSIMNSYGVDIKGSRKINDLRMFTEATFLLLCSINNVHEDDQYPDLQTFFENYGEDFFRDLNGNIMNDDEMKKLLKYRNYMAIAVKYINPVQNKDYLLNLITKLAEGCNTHYISGSGASLATNRRIDIYRKEGGVVKKQRQPRQQVVEPDSPCLKRGRSLNGGGIPSPPKRLRKEGEEKDEPTVGEAAICLVYTGKTSEKYVPHPIDFDLDGLINNFDWCEPEQLLSQKECFISLSENHDNSSVPYDIHFKTDMADLFDLELEI